MSRAASFFQPKSLLRHAVAALSLAAGTPAMSQLNPDVSLNPDAWFNRTHEVREVEVSGGSNRYSIKNNPAVDLMRKVIAARKATRLENNDFYSYSKYSKITFALNDIVISDLQTGLLSKIPGALSQIDACPYNNKLILPLTVNETVSRHYFRRRPHSEETRVEASRAGGLNNMFQSGELVTATLRDFFSDVNIYDSNVRLFQKLVPSPIGASAIQFYHFYLSDTLMVGADRCVSVFFTPANKRDFGFCGYLYILDDSTYRVRRAEMSVPARSDVNFIEGFSILQEFGENDGRWTLIGDDMVAELGLFDFIYKAVAIRHSRLDSYTFGPLPDSVFAAQPSRSVADAATRTDSYWENRRSVGLTTAERNVDGFIGGAGQSASQRLLRLGTAILVENYLPLSSDKSRNRFDIGKVTSFISTNHVDGFRMKFGGHTTANLSPHLFVSGWAGYGFKSRNPYYDVALTYSFNRKKYLPHEFPMRNIVFSSMLDMGLPADRSAFVESDNVFSMLSWADNDKMVRRNRQQVSLVREEECGLRTELAVAAESSAPRGSLLYVPLSAGEAMPSMRTTEVRLALRYAPGENYVSTKGRRWHVNRDAMVLSLSHTMGIRGFLGGGYRYNITEASLYKRFWLGDWGRTDVRLRAGAQWDRVPFPLLLMPAANLSYVAQDGTFNLLGDMEFVNDRFVSADVVCDLNGKLFNRLPLLKHLRWRERFGFKMLWGELTSKNNPLLESNASSNLLMELPAGTGVMDPSRPYFEMFVGVHNIFRFFSIDYVHRFSYLDLPTATRNGVRFGFRFQF